MWPCQWGAADAQETGRDTAKTAEPEWRNGYPTEYDVMLHNKSWAKEEEEEYLEWFHLSFHYLDEPSSSPALQEMAKHLPADGK